MVTSLQILCLVLLSASILDAASSFTNQHANTFWQVIKRFQITLRDLEGTWETDIRNADCAILVDGQVATVCRVNLPPDCQEEIPAGHEKYVIQDGTIQQSYVHLKGIKTEEAAKKAFPICAKYKVYPTEFKIGVPTSKIISYNSISGHLRYHDARRPESTDCVIALYTWTRSDDVYLAFQQIVGYEGTLEDVMKNGPSVRCNNPPEKCDVGFDKDDPTKLHLAFHNKFDLYCTSGRCRYKKSVPSEI
eukprot:g7314.t1